MSRRAEALLVALVGAATVALHFALFSRYLPGPAGTIGHDYGYFFPQLLNGTYWYTNNGLLEVPWFTPALGAGVPYYPNPVNAYYSFPQVLAWFVDPLRAVRATLVVFAAVGYLGTFALLRRVFATSLPAALFGACAFAFNGFFAHRMLVGHLAFHSFMLIPAMGYWALRRPPGGELRGRGAVAQVVLLGLAYAYLVQSANVHGIPVAFLAVAAFALIEALRRGWSWGWIERTAVAGGLALALCAAKLCATIAFMGAFPRSGYSLPGFSSVGSALAAVFDTLFLGGAHEGAAAAIVYSSWKLDRHEFEYGITIVPLVLLTAGAIAGIVVLVRSAPARAAARRRGWLAVPLLVVLAIPVALNVHGPHWTAFVESLPVLGSASNMIRFLSLYVPLAVVGAALGLDRLVPGAKWRGAAALAAVLATLGLQWSVDRGYYERQPYRPGPIVAAWQAVQDTGKVPPVERIVAPFDAAGRPALPIDRNDALIRGESQLVCYEPIFGYQQEWFPFGPVRYGMPALAELDGGVLNVKNPACFVFPELNGGPPGSHFRVDQRRAAERFLAYRPFAFEPSRSQTIADGINLGALVLLALLAVRAASRAGRRAG